MTLFSVISYAYFFLTGAIGIGIAVAIRLATFPFDPDGLLVHKMTKAFVSHYMQLVPGWSFEFEGLDQFPKDKPYVIVVNHQSAFDPLVLYMLPIMFKWTAKSWVFKMPVIGSLLYLTNSLEISKGNPLIFLHRCRAVLDKGMSVLLFPEGTRSPDGELLPFKFGAFHLSVAEKVPILPVVLSGTRFIIRKNDFFNLGRNANVTIKVLPPIDPGRFDYDEKALRDYTRSIMANEIHALAEASPIAELSEAS